MSIFIQGENYLEYHNAGEILRIISWGENSFRVISVPSGSLNLECSALLPQDSDAEIQIGEDCASITNGKITAILRNQADHFPAVLSFYNEKKELLLEETDRGGALVRRARRFKPISGSDYRLTVTFQSDKNEKIYGMGQYQQDILNLKGCSLELAHKNTQASIPFYLSSKGYGFFWHNPAIGRVFFGMNATEWYAESSRQMDYWITAGDTPAEIERQYTMVTGRAPMMPEYGLGYWQCKLRYKDQEEVLEVAREYHRRGIPLDVLVIDYYHWPYCGDYRFDENFFPDPEAMAKEVESYGTKLMVSVWPQVDTRSENFSEMYEKGLLVQTETGINVQMLFQGNNVFYDATNPESRKYVWEKCRKNYYDKGIELFWLDEAEPEFTTYDYDNYRYYKGSVLQTGNIYPREYARGFFEGQQKAGQKEILNLVRCAWAGSQRYGALVWSGDIASTYEDFRKQITAGLQMGLAGIPWWTTDIGGFNGGFIEDEDFQELLIRWFQFAAFCPVMRMHGNRLPRTSIFKKSGEETEGTGAPNEIWSYGEENYQIMKKFINIREKLRPYSRTLMQQAHEEGAPVMRTMFYEFPEDSSVWDISDQYMYGADILVAPIIEPHALSRTVYLPERASWTDARSGQTYTGGQWITVSAPIDTIPVFFRDGKKPLPIGVL